MISTSESLPNVLSSVFTAGSISDSASSPNGTADPSPVEGADPPDLAGSRVVAVSTAVFPEERLALGAKWWSWRSSHNRSALATSPHD